MSTPVVVGGEVDSWCTRCKLELNHVVVAMLGPEPKKVMCLTCRSEHVFHAHKPAPAATKPPSAARVRASRVKPLPAADPNAPARDYSPASTFAAGQVLQHAQYGRGRVGTVRGNKIDVAFIEGPQRTLVHTPRA